MNRHFLVAVSGDKSALQGLRFLGSFFSDKQRIRSTLFYSGPGPHAMWADETSLSDRARHKAQEKHIQEAGRQALETAAAKAADLGLLKATLSQTLRSSRFSTVTDIIQEGETGSYDAVVLGRRSLGLLASAFETSVSKALFEQPLSFPLWLCRAIEPGRKHVLLYGDGSPTSFTMADHTGLILAGDPRHQVDILLDENTAKNEGAKARYASILNAHRIGTDRISWLPHYPGPPATVILRLIKEQGYAAVALGRDNRETHLFARLRKGPVSSVLFREVTQAALWICH